MSDIIERTRTIYIDLPDDSQIQTEITIKLSASDYRTESNQRLNTCNIAEIVKDLQDSICRQLGIDPAAMVEGDPYTSYETEDDDAEE
jgi:hypothetical protein